MIQFLRLSAVLLFVFATPVFADYACVITVLEPGTHKVLSSFVDYESYTSAGYGAPLYREGNESTLVTGKSTRRERNQLSISIVREFHILRRGPQELARLDVPGNGAIFRKIDRYEFMVACSAVPKDKEPDHAELLRIKTAEMACYVEYANGSKEWYGGEKCVKPEIPSVGQIKVVRYDWRARKAKSAKEFYEHNWHCTIQTYANDYVSPPKMEDGSRCHPDLF